MKVGQKVKGADKDGTGHRDLAGEGKPGVDHVVHDAAPKQLQLWANELEATAERVHSRYLPVLCEGYYEYTIPYPLSNAHWK